MNVNDNQYQFCDYCYMEAPTRYITLHQSAGVIFFWIHAKMQANLCRSCINKHFWEFTLVSIFGGIFSIPSILANIYIIPANIIRYLKSRDLKIASKNAFILDLSDDILRKILTVKDIIFSRIDNNDPLPIIADDMANKLGIRPGHIIIYIKIFYGLMPEELGLLHECTYCGSKNIDCTRATYKRNMVDRLNDGYWERYYCKCKNCDKKWIGISTDEIEDEFEQQNFKAKYPL